MNISRNAPCHCGSGKKYKRCCASVKKYTLSTAKQNHKNQQIDEADNEESLTEMDEEFGIDHLAEMSEMLGGMSKDELYERIFSLHQKFRYDDLKNLEHIKQYTDVRTIHEEIVDSMVAFYDEGKFEQKVDSSAYKEHEDGYRTGENPIALIDCEFDMTKDLGAKSFFDIMIYKYAPNMNCITDVFIEENCYSTPEEREMLQSMLDSTIGLFEVIEVEKEMAYVTLKNVFTGEEFKITDVAFSGSPGSEDNYMYARIITYKGISFSTGIGMIFLKNDKFIRKFIENEKKDYKPFGELLRMTNLYKYLNSATLEETRVKVVNSNTL